MKGHKLIFVSTFLTLPLFHLQAMLEKEDKKV